MSSGAITGFPSRRGTPGRDLKGKWGEFCGQPLSQDFSGATVGAFNILGSERTTDAHFVSLGDFCNYATTPVHGDLHDVLTTPIYYGLYSTSDESTYGALENRSRPIYRWPTDPGEVVLVPSTSATPTTSRTHAGELQGSSNTSWSLTGNAAFHVYSFPRRISPEKGWNPRSAILDAIGSADLVEFEDGLENGFTNQLFDALRKYGNTAVEELATVIFLPGINVDAAAQALMFLGRVNHESSYLARSWVLQRGLFSSLDRIRDAAVVGIASLNDPRARESLSKAIERERSSYLREDMGRVLSFLRSEI